jgi:tRNA (cytidine/uridine-2'-O-)-methyltransferase
MRTDDSNTPPGPEDSGVFDSGSYVARAHLDDPIAHVVLVNPEIPNNTGNIGRTCVATHSVLHLVHPIAFDIDEKACRRAGLDYWPRLDLREHDSFGDYEESRRGGANVWYLTARAARSITQVEFARGDHLVFGRESAGLDRAILDAHPERCVSIPMVPGERSLNLSTAAAVSVHALIGALVRRGELGIDAEGRLDPSRRG